MSCPARRCSPMNAGRGQHRPQVGVLGRRDRRRHADEDRHRPQRGGHPPVTTTAQPAVEGGREPVIRDVVDRGPSGIQLGDATGEGVDPFDLESGLDEGDRQRQAGIPESDDGHAAVLVSRSPPTSCVGATSARSIAVEPMSVRQPGWPAADRRRSIVDGRPGPGRRIGRRPTMRVCSSDRTRTRGGPVRSSSSRPPVASASSAANVVAQRLGRSLRNAPAGPWGRTSVRPARRRRTAPRGASRPGAGRRCRSAACRGRGRRAGRGRAPGRRSGPARPCRARTGRPCVPSAAASRMSQAASGMVMK